MAFEQENIATNERLVRHLLKFLPRKSLSVGQRNELIDWIEEEIHGIEINPFRELHVAEQLREIMHKALTELHAYAIEKVKDKEISPDELEDLRDITSEMFKGRREFSDEQLKYFYFNPDELKTEFEAFMDEVIEGSFGDDEHEDEEYHQEHDVDEFQAERNERLKGLFENSELGKIYKLLANKLHPDKEADPELKAFKSEQMGLLSKAKKAKDAFTLIQMFQIHLPEKAKEFDPNLTESLCDLLDEKVTQLEFEYRGIEEKMGLAGAVWMRFGDKTNRAIERNFDEHIDAMAAENEESEYTINHVTNLKRLKAELADREMSFGDVGDLEGFQDLFDSFEGSFMDEEIF